jgi:hypothetical protein
VQVTGVAAVAPSAATHGFNTNQRVINLVIVSQDAAGRTLKVRAPPDSSVAPPQLYMLFLLNGKTHSSGKWLRFGAGATPAALSNP